MMKKIYLLFILSFTTLGAQKIDKDIFGNFVFEDSRNRFTAHLEKDIFNAVSYKDSRNNLVKFDTDYVKKYLPELFKDENATIAFFGSQISEYSNEKNYIKNFEIDIIGKETIIDNRNNKSQNETDIFGNYQYQDTFNGKKTKISQSLNGDWNFKSGGLTATFVNNFRNNFEYKDSEKNEVEINTTAMKNLKQKFGSEKEVFFFLIHSFLD